MIQTLALRRKAGELRVQARVKQDELTKQIKEQMEDGFEGTKLSHEEINKRSEEVSELIAEAKALEDVDTTEGIMGRGDDVTKGAREILNSAKQDAADDDGEKIFSSLGEFLRGVRLLTGPSEILEDWRPNEDQLEYMSRMWHGATAFSRGDPISKEFDVGRRGHVARKFYQDRKALVGDDTGSTGRGDFLVPTEHMAELLRVMGEQQQFVNRARRIPMSRRTLDFPRLAQTDATDTRPLFSFAAVTKIAEGVLKPEHEPVFEQLVLTAIKYAAYVEASDELLSDSIVGVAPVLIDLLTSAIGYEYDRDGMRGSGTGEPQGFIDSAAEFAEGRNTLNAVVLDDVLQMMSRFFGSNGIWLYHPSVLPQLGVIAQSNVIFWQRDISTRQPGTLFGLPLIPSHKLPVLGLKGDINLVDPSFYLYGDLQRITVASSTHFKFRNDITAWRAIFRAAGTPWPAGTFSHESDGTTLTYEVSPFVVLRQTVVS